MLIRHCTLPKDKTLLQRSARPHSDGFPRLPFSPEPGTGDAGWLIGSESDPIGFAWLRRQTGKRGLFDFDLPGSALEAAWPAVREQAAAWEMERIVANIPADDSGALEEMTALGFSRHGALLSMTGPVPRAPAMPGAPPNHFLRPYLEFGHLPTLAALLHRAYHDLPSRPESETDGVTVDIVRAEMEIGGEDEIARDYFLLINDFGKGVGVVRCRPGGWVDGPGIVPEERDIGLHRTLLAAALVRLAETGVENARLVVYEPIESWVADYTGMGFRPGIERISLQMELA